MYDLSKMLSPTSSNFRSSWRRLSVFESFLLMKSSVSSNFSGNGVGGGSAKERESTGVVQYYTVEYSTVVQ